VKRVIVGAIWIIVNTCCAFSGQSCMVKDLCSLTLGLGPYDRKNTIAPLPRDHPLGLSLLFMSPG
jgi:hypothetical protein